MSESKSSKYIDYLKENPEFEYKGMKQLWALMSFVSPEGIKNCKIRGLKIHCVLDDYEVAKKTAENFRLIDPDFHVFVGPVGKWLPWDPDPNTSEDQVYQEKELNELVKGYKENLEKAKKMEQQRKEDMLKQAKDDQLSRKEKQKKRMREKLEARKLANKVEEQKVETVDDDEDTDDNMDMEKEEQIMKIEKTKLDESKQELEEKEKKLDDIENKLNKIQAIYNKLNKK